MWHILFKKSTEIICLFAIVACCVLLGIDFYFQKTQWQLNIDNNKDNLQVFSRYLSPSTSNTTLSLLFDISDYTSDWFFANRAQEINKSNCIVSICSSVKFDGKPENYIFKRFFSEKKSVFNVSFQLSYECKKGGRILFVIQDENNLVIKKYKLKCNNSTTKYESNLITKGRFIDLAFIPLNSSSLNLYDISLKDLIKDTLLVGKPNNYVLKIVGHSKKTVNIIDSDSESIIDLCDEKTEKAKLYRDFFRTSLKCKFGSKENTYHIKEYFFSVNSSIEKYDFFELSLSFNDFSRFTLPKISFSKSNDPLLFLPCISCNVRASSFFYHPNLAGHSVVAFFLLFMLTIRHVWWGYLIYLIVLLTVLWTGSRAALLSLIFLIPWLPRIKIPNFVLSKYFSSVIIFCFIFIFSMLSLGQLNIRQGEITRQSVWKVAVHTLQDSFLTGVSEKEFAERYLLEYPALKGQSVLHAHNFWLQMGVRFGILGLLGSIFLTGYLTFLAWLWGKWQGVGFVAPFWIMNFFDYSLSYVAVWIPMALGLLFLYDARKNQLSGKMITHKVV